MNSCSNVVPDDLARELALGRAARLDATLRREVLGEVRPDQLLAVVAQHELERAVHIGDLVIHRDRADRLVRVLEEVAVAILALPRGIARARALDRDAGQVRRQLDEVAVALRALAGLAVVERERAEQHAVGREERRRPAGAQLRLLGQLAEVLPERVGRDVRDADPLAEVGGGAARSDLRADRDAVHRLAPERRAGSARAVAQVHAVAVEQQDRGEQIVVRSAPRRSARCRRGRAGAPRPWR